MTLFSTYFLKTIVLIAAFIIATLSSGNLTFANTADATLGTKPIFVLNSQDADISVIDPITLREIRRIPTGKEPHHQYITPDEKSLIIANAGGNSLTFIDPRTGEIQRTIRNLLDPYHLRFSPDMKWFVTAANRLNFVDIYRWENNEPVLAKRVPTSKTPSHMFIDSKSTVAYVTMQDSDELVAIELATQTIRWRVPTGSTPADVFLSADDKRVFVALTGGDSVEVFDVSQPLKAAPLLQRIKTGAGAHAFRARGDKRHVFVSNRVANTISLLDTTELKVVESFPAPGGPDCMEITADGKTLMVTSRWARKLTFIDIGTKKIRAQVNVGRSPHGVWTLDHASRQ